MQACLQKLLEYPVCVYDLKETGGTLVGNHKDWRYVFRY